MRFTIFQESRVGKRRTNQDRVAYSYTRDALLLVLADGMGGHLYGEVAAQISVQFIAQSFQQEARPKVTDPILFLSRVLSNAHHAILDYAFDKHLADIPRTTIVACLVQEGVAHWAHAGDSRLYLIRKGKLVTQTRDHSRVQLMLDQGLLDAESAAVHPGRNRIFSCLGGSHPPQIEFSRGVPPSSMETSSPSARTASGGLSIATPWFKPWPTAGSWTVSRSSWTKPRPSAAPSATT
jgi:serine/threonine protein phosphatase PrpC